MKAPERLPFTQWADINRTARFVSVEPLSGYRLIRPEDESRVIYLAPNASDEELGRALLESLDRSRFIWPPDDPEFTNRERYMRSYQNWQEDMVRRFGYKSKRDAYKNMDWCRAERSEGKITIRPHKRDKPGYWDELPRERDVVIPETRDTAVVGSALRLALDRDE